MAKRKSKEKRNWSEYNEELVVRGEFYLDLGFVNNWNDELFEMNRGKKGGQYRFPDSFISWRSCLEAMDRLSWSLDEGIARSLAKMGFIPEYNDYTTIWHRVHDMVPEITLPTEKDLEVATDGSGLKTNNAGEYRVFKYGEKTKKKHLVVVITADIKQKKLLKVEAQIEGEGESEPKIAEKHLEELKKDGVTVKKFYGDGAFDTNALFEYLEESKIESAIKIRKNASTCCRGSKRRREEIREYLRLGYNKWSNKKRYGMRWVATEGIFSAVKRKFGEKTVSRSKNGLIAEAIQRFWNYDLLRAYGMKKVREMQQN
ncbi:MAG: Transposase DDE domain protein [Candidatus Methanolliviera sp. GoM_asphalt]|nr:MAG: Transposase DDE domain protein [Candidatus Methanolliviera sp. GoM_asphalt]